MKFLTCPVTTCAALLLCSSMTLQADDTEVFFGRVDQTMQIRPNVLFVLDSSLSMRRTDVGASDTRMARLQSALVGILEGATNLNIGLMRFSGHLGGGPVQFPVRYIDEQICSEGDCGIVPLINRINSIYNDAEENLASDSVSVNGNVLDMGEEHGNDTLIALRFTNLDVPSGAIVTSATLQFVAEESSSAPASFSIGVEDSGDSAALNSDTANLSNRTRASISKHWSPTSWVVDEQYESPEIKTVVQQVINRSDWCGGNDITLFVEGSGARDAISADSDVNRAPVLKLNYDAATIPPSMGCSNKTVVSKVRQKNDDAEENYRNQWMRLNDRALNLPRNGWKQQLVGLRFQDIQIPNGATITEASIEFEIDQYQRGWVQLDIWGEDSDNALVFQKRRRDISDRPKTSAKTVWSNPPEAGVNQKITTPDLTNILQELVNRGGWSSGNAMAFIIQSGAGFGSRAVESYDGEPSNAPTLTVKFTASGSPNVITVRDKLIEAVNGLQLTFATPILDTLYEAALYYRGAPVEYGRSRGTNLRRRDERQFHRLSHPESYTGGSVYLPPGCSIENYSSTNCRLERINDGPGGPPVYKSPMTSSCQSDHIILVSDGAPTLADAVNKVKSLTGNSHCEHVDRRACITDLAEWMATEDHSTGLSGEQNITTYAIGFGEPHKLEFLRDVAKAGLGQYFEAVSAEHLQTAFSKILADVLDVETSFVAPGATVNQFNRLTHRNDIYFSLFKPGESPSWDGNLKKYQLKNMGDDTVRIVDSTGTPAVDEGSGFFSTSSKSFWSDEIDGNEVYRGGMAGEIELTNAISGKRKVYTYTGVDSPDNVLLSSSAHELSENNGNITKAMLGINTEPDSYRSNLLKWARGVDVDDSDNDTSTTDVRKHIGDPMHSRPLLINYNAGAANIDSTIFVATNEGFLHAVRHDTGQELFSFIPQELLPNLNDFYINSSSTPHPYGLDGAMSTWVDDANDNTMVDSGEHAYIYLGMRRGGNNYYALDVSDRTKPKLKWIIKGGIGGTPGFEELAQSWSKPVFAKIKYGSDLHKPVLIFGAGYDINQDANPASPTLPRRTDGNGRGIFIVDAKTGAKIWSGSPNSSTGNHTLFPKMDYSIPSDIRVVDIDFDGSADQFYVGDMGGQVWRFDFNKEDSSTSLFSGGVIADFANSQPNGARRFYYEPDVALLSNDGTKYLSIAIGSGWRAHPLDSTVKDRFYMIRSEDIYAKPAGYGKATGSGSSVSYSPITEADLLDVTNKLTPTHSALMAKEGWMLRMEESGEKILGDSITVNNQLVFTSYKPNLDVGVCDAAAGGGSVYTVDMFDGSPSLDLDESDSGTANRNDLDKSDRSKDLKHGGIPPEPAALITEDGIPVVLVGPEQPLDEFDFGNLTERTWWLEETVE